MERRARHWIDGRFLRSRVARRVFFLVLASALVPMLSFALLSYAQVTRQLERDADARLVQEAKQLGMAALERLLLLEAALETFDADTLAQAALARGRFRGFTELPASGLDAAELAQLEAGRSLLRVDRISRIWLVRRDARRQRIVAAELEPRFLFVPEALRSNVDLTVHSEGAPLFIAQRSAPELEKRSGAWELFLRPQFRGPTWKLALSEPQASLLAPLARFRALFPLVTLLALLAVGLATLVLVRRSLVPIELLHAATRRIAERDFTARVELRTGDEFEDLALSFDAMAASIERHVEVVETVSSVGRALSVEQDAERLLGTILRGTMSVTDAKAGALSLTDASDRLVRHLLLDWGSAADRALASRLERLAHEAAASGRTLHDAERGELSIPMRNHEGAVIGVLQLVRGGAFDAEGLALAESLASQTAVALTKHRLAGEFRALFEGLIQLIVKAIDQKSPYTGEHCRRVPILTELIADAACTASEGPLKHFTLSDAQRYELRIAALLHDCGKVTTPVHVQDKSSKLESLFDRIELVEARFEIARRELELAALRGDAASPADADPDVAARLAALEEDLLFLRAANVGGEYMSRDRQERVREIAARWSWRTREGVIEPILSADEVENLCISRGTLTESERIIINGHMVQTIKMLQQLPFPRNLRRVPEYAGGHHEKRDGTGYPKGIFADEMSIPARIMVIADVFEALTSSDRPYKKPKSLSETMKIMGFLKRDNHLDPDLFDLFVKSGMYRKCGELFVKAEQLDAVDEAALLALKPKPFDLAATEIRAQRWKDFLPQYRGL